MGAMLRMVLWLMWQEGTKEALHVQDKGATTPWPFSSVTIYIYIGTLSILLLHLHLWVNQPDQGWE